MIDRLAKIIIFCVILMILALIPALFWAFIAQLGTMIIGSQVTFGTIFKFIYAAFGFVAVCLGIFVGLTES
jgi:hypothetical protein